MRGVKKQHLPEKMCVACGRPFAWRKKWERDWANVKFCSDACRLGKGPAGGGRNLTHWRARRSSGKVNRNDARRFAQSSAPNR